ncbi:MAG: glutamine-hydrolyzing GMP synthase [Oscillospiraceae bacterium]|jgi:GMP synthase (glutamine-hydrolysing)|nr:glutamine-hydrolyzing GMP synthase [Oscillospiraceae bacterium]
MDQLIIVLDFGGQYKELIARRVRECGVSSVIWPGDTAADKIKQTRPIGLILTGGPDSVYMPGAPKCDSGLFTLGIPILGICYGLHLTAYALGGTVAQCAAGEYGRTEMTLDASCPLFDGMDSRQVGLMSHTDQVTALPAGFVAAGSTRSCQNAVIMDRARAIYGVQFHPEVENTPNGTAMIRNFLYKVCNAAGGYDIGEYEARVIDEIRAQVGEERVLLGLSGGVDSSVCAALLAKAVPGKVYCIFVDHGFMRKNEGDEIGDAFPWRRKLRLIHVSAGARFLKLLKGVEDPETKRKRIGAEFVRVFEDEAKRLGDIKFLAQGTIYPDVVESGANKSATIKSHHNVGGLPDSMAFKELVEPLRGLFKDEVRMLGRRLGLPKALVERQPFPGPGLAVRIIGEVTSEKLGILREADSIFREEVRQMRDRPDQYFAVLTDTRSVGVMGDFRTYGYTIALRAVKTTDFMTCEYAHIPHKVLKHTVARIVGEVPGVTRVVYDITGKPPATIEWE